LRHHECIAMMPIVEGGDVVEGPASACSAASQ
jgi:hypothetical protein